MICPRCGRTLPDGTAICPECGMVLATRPDEDASASETALMPALGAHAAHRPAHAAPSPESEPEGARAEVAPDEAPADHAEPADEDSDATVLLDEPVPGAPAEDEATPSTDGDAADPTQAGAADATAVAPRPDGSADGRGDQDGPLYVATYGQFRAEDPGETQYMTVPFISDIGVVSTEGDEDDDDDQPLRGGHFAVPDTLAESAPLEGGLPQEHYTNRRRDRRRRLVYWLVGLVIVGVVAGIAWYTWDQELWGGTRVPDVVGLTLGEAESALKVKGLSYTVEEMPSDDGFNTVVSTDPAAGRRCLEGESVTINVAVPRTVPNVIGLKEDVARQQLEDAGATNVKVTYENSSAEEGTVLSVDPDVGEQFLSSDTVTLVVAQPYQVPKVVGLTRQEATEAIEDAGLVAEVTFEESDTDDDVVLSSSPAEGTVVEKGSTVTITLPLVYPDSPSDLAGYYRLSSEQVSEWLGSQGFSLRQGGTYQGSGDAYTVWDGPSGDRIYFTDVPESVVGPSGYTDTLSQGLAWNSIRYQCAGSSVGATQVSEANAIDLARQCGFTSTVLNSCTSQTMVTPYSLNPDAFDIACVQGESDGYVWVVLLYRARAVTSTVVTPSTSTVQTQNEDGSFIEQKVETNTTTTTTTREDSQTTGIVAYMPTATASVSGLSQYGGSFANYFAYANTYSS